MENRRHLDRYRAWQKYKYVKSALFVQGQEPSNRTGGKHFASESSNTEISTR
ncbi:hypothetical protein [Fibrella forsythiae]|uniref:Uncharacterized protein n=1 Tax=Fibrella forsythiae TaxID=2817061 RepID=A0ABS3JMF2_9BACT|nr:hypothetical protein [Fibrella forsythiae]MBO0951190.1 hypothetical protein [Fibrella forsythiae]